MSDKSFKIAVVSNNGSTVSQRFGSAPFYEVFTIENGLIINRERREKYNAHAPGTHHHHNLKDNAGMDAAASILNTGNHSNGNGHGYGFGQDSNDKHNSMIQNISDCRYLITRGMGYGIYYHLENANITPIITNIQMIEDSVKALIDGSIINHYEKLH